MGSAATFIVTRWSDIWAQLRWRDQISAIYLSIPGESLFKNTGDGDVYISTLDVSTMYGRSESLPIGIVVEKGRFVVKTTPLESESGVLANHTGTLNPKLIAEVGKSPIETSCIATTLVTPNATYLAVMKQAYDRDGLKVIMTLVDGALNFISGHSGKLYRQKIDLMMLYSVKRDEKCLQQNWTDE